tara:strand:- start:141 stop:506 length:366 start_codon:yes stop_codon:yes gene_type:complete
MERMYEISWEEMNGRPSAFDYREYFKSRYFLFWVLLMAIVPPIFFIWFPLQVYLFFFYWPNERTSVDDSLTDRNRHDGASSSFSTNADKNDILEEGNGSWWGEDIPVAGQRKEDNEWWKRI